MIKKIALSIVFLSAFNFSFGQTTLFEGDIAITGVNSDNPDQFSFVLLTDVLNTTVIHFTDCGWVATGGFRNYNPVNGRIGEGIITWTATSNLSCGTEIVIGETATGSNVYSATTGTASETDNNFALAANGDQLIAFQGTTGSPTFLHAIHFATATNWTDAISANTSAVPAGLTDGVNAIYLGNRDNNNYLCTVTSNQPLILQAVATVNATNWYQTNRNNAANRPVLGGCTYTCATAGSCASTVTWNGTWSGTPNLTTEVIISANYNTSSSSFKACNLTVDPGVTLTVNDGTHVEVENDVVVNGNLFVTTEGSFVQNDNSGTFTVNPGGVSRVNKNTSIKNAWYYYTYWSSPVDGETIQDAFPNTDVDRRFSYNAANYVDANGDNIDDNADAWTYALGGDTMLPGVGYAATSGRFGFYPSTDNASFTGPFNTGNKSTTISYNPINTAGSWNFIGNPYPSAIDFIAFQQANSAVIDGAAYFWSQASPPDAANPGNEPLNFNLNDYAAFTIGTGGVAGGVTGKIPTGYIASAQGFFVPALSTGTVTFTNAIRMADDINNSQFFKVNKTKKSNTNNTLENKLWINLTSGNGVFNQALVGYVDGATNNNDGMSYDAPKLLAQDYAAAIYTSIDNDAGKYVIQGKDVNSININETIKLGFTTNIKVATIYKLSIAQLEGNFLNENTIYLIDNLQNKLHNLSATDYTFTSETGEFNNRFKIVFNADALSTNKTVISTNKFSIVDLDNDNVQFNTNSNLNIKTIRVFDLLGRQLYNIKGNTNSETHTLSNLKTTIYIAKIELSNGIIITKKFLKTAPKN